MKEGQKLWTREELILAINLYCKLPFGRLSSTTKEVIELSKLLGRTPSSVALKLVNFSSLDPTLQQRGIKGMGNASKLDRAIWNEFYSNWDVLLIESEILLANKRNTTIDKINKIETDDLPKEGKEKERLIKTRINQAMFRTIVLATYNNTCCITGINNTELLTASHIVPWSKDKRNRLNPTNGLCLNALHDRAFDRGLITISAKDYTIKISSTLKDQISSRIMKINFSKMEGNEILLPDKFLPSKEQLKIHNNFFKP